VITALVPAAERRTVTEGLAYARGGLPLVDTSELEHATGFVWIVRSFVTLPLTTLGLLATIAASTMGNIVAAVFAGTITVLIVLSLYRDTQLSKAVEMLRRGEMNAAEASLRRIAEAPHRAIPQRQRARAYLAAIAWVRGELEVALQWTRAWLTDAGASGQRTSADEVYLIAASEVQLLALLGRHDEAGAAFEELEPAPPGDRWAIADAGCRLLLAFFRGDAEPVRGSLQGWCEVCQRGDRHGLPTALLAWAHHALRMPDRAVVLAERARQLARSGAQLRRQAPTVSQWLARYDGRALQYRR
jgi:tetratricopeptide (TPR) repeat protein